MTRALLLALCLFWIARPALADTLFTDTGGGGFVSDQIGDRRSALGPGALVTVLVNEDIKAQQSANTTTSKDSHLTTTWDFGTLLPKLTASKMDLEGKDDFTGDGTTTRGGTITMSVACQVQEILPDGSLRIKGSKELLVNEEKSTVTLSGIVRPWDINSLNQVTSDKIADLQLDYQGSGPSTAKATPGLLGRLLNWLF
ncbi:MAG: flagellar basal body L-ring protein FlgH [Cyanobacteria bacterium REEB65]|nr:flagellar basal body L-ring protein FlgH [Cyanobacteria bacterium REEB65]